MERRCLHRVFPVSRARHPRWRALRVSRARRQPGFTDVDITTAGNDSDGFNIGSNAATFTFDGVTILARGDDGDGLVVGTGLSGFDLDDVTIRVEGDSADAIRLGGGTTFSLDDSTINGVFNGYVLDSTGVTTLSGTGNTARDFAVGMLFNDGGGNGGTLTFTTVDQDDDGVNEGPVTITP